MARPTMREIAERTAAEHALTLAQLRSATRRKAICHPRQEAMAGMKASGFSHRQIINFFGLKDHTTCVHACHAVKARAAGLPVRPMSRRAPVDNAARNARILVLSSQSLTRSQIAARMGLTRGIVSGVIGRHGAALAQQEAA